jgi:hypothetical protein
MRTIRRFRRLLLAVVSLAISCPMPIASASTQPIDYDLTKEADARAYVRELTGFARLRGITESSARVDVNDNTTPFLHEKTSGKGLWRVSSKNVRLSLKSAPPAFEDKYLRNFDVLIDPNTGHLLKITSKFDGTDANMLPEPPAQLAQKQMMAAREMYHGFPVEPPQISFLDALDAIFAKGVGSPLLAKEIHAVYVTHSKMDSKPRSAWVITLRGIPALPVIGGPPNFPRSKWPPVYQRNHIRNVVHAHSGRILLASTIPQPEDPRDKKDN